MVDDDFDDDFSLDDDEGSEEASSAASEDGDDGSGSDDDAVSDVLESDLDEDDDDAPKRKSGKRTASPAKRSAQPAAKRKSAATPAAPKRPAPIATSKVSAKTTSSPAKKATAAKTSTTNATTTPAAAVPPTLKAGDAKAAVLDYMRKTNRPYSMLNVFENMHKVIAKPSLQKLLDDLCDKNELVGKTYGKAKIYYINQTDLPVPSPSERAAIEQQIDETERACVVAEQELKASEATLSGINAQLSDADLDVAIAALEQEQQTLSAKLETLERPGQQPIPPGRKDALKRQFNKYRTAWVQRKRIVVDAVNQIADGMEKKPKAVYTLCEIETDADAGVKEVPPAMQ